MSAIDFLLNLFRDEEARAEFTADPDGYTAEHLPAGLTGADILDALPAVCGELPPEQAAAVRTAFQLPGGYADSSTPPPPPPTQPGESDFESVMRQINYFTDVTNITEQHYEDNDTSIVNDQDTIVDNSVNQEITAFGDVVQDFDTNTAIGDGSVAGAYGSQVQTGDGIQVGGDVDDSNLVSGDVTNSTLADDITDSAVVSGSTVGGSVVGGDVEDSILGNENQAIIDSNVGAAGFGSGDVTNVQVDDSNISESALGGGDVSSNDVNITADDGAAVAFGGGDASGSNTDVDIEGDNFGTVQAAGNEADQDSLTDNSVNDSFNTTVEDNDTDNSVDNSINDSFNATDSFNSTVEDNDTTTDDDVIDIA